jgi:hypothetical protein
LLASVLGASLTGVAAVTAAAWAASRLLPPTVKTSVRRWFGVSVGVSLGASLMVGQVPFLLGLAFGLAAILALLRGHSRTTVLLSAACSLSSPLSGLFLLLTVPGLAAQVGWRRSVQLGGALAGMALAALVGGASGPFPCAWTSLAAVWVFCGLGWLISTPEDRVLRRLMATYALAAGLSFVAPTPVGGNIDRVAWVACLPSACLLLAYRGAARRVVGLALLPALFWTVLPVTTAVARGAGDPSRQAAYYAGLLGFLATQNPIDGRLEIPLTRGHWESSFVAPSFPLARGWERQTDLLDNPPLYDALTPESYRAWLDDAGVSLVALPNAPLDRGGLAEAQLLAYPPSYLHLVYRDADWQVWRVAGSVSLVTGAATMTTLGPASFVLEFPHPGTAVIRLRSSGLWQISAGQGCLSSTSDGWLQLATPRAGLVTVRARVNSQLITGAADCGDQLP